MSTILALVAKRVALGLLTIIVISIFIFVGVEALPGDLATAILGKAATPETVAAFRRELKLDLPPTFAISPGWAIFCGVNSVPPCPTDVRLPG